MNDAYLDFLEKKRKVHVESGFDVGDLNYDLFEFQKFVVKRALHHGKYAVFSGTGTGKTRQQLAWANEIVKHTDSDVLILAPLAVSGQTIKEGKSIGIEVRRWCDDELYATDEAIYIINYEQLENLPIEFIKTLGGIALDEASIIKNHEGAYRNKIIELFYDTPYKSVWTATPSPNDPMELGNYSEFLNVMPRNEMLAMYFVHDAGETQKWRLKGHAKQVFWEWVSTWAIMFQNPKDIGFEQEGFDLPPLNFIERKIVAPKKDNGKLFNDVAVSATNFNAELRITKLQRLEDIAPIVNNSQEKFIIWIKQNEEGELLRKLIPDAIEVKGDDSTEYKEDVADWFTQNKCICKHLKKKQPTIKNGGSKTNTNQKNITSEERIKSKPNRQHWNLSKKEKDIIPNGILKIKTELENTICPTESEKTNGEEKNILPILNIDKDIEKLQSNGTETIQKQNLEQGLRNTDLHLNNIESYLQSNMVNAQYAGQSHLLSQQNKDCTLTIATPQEKSEDCFAEIVTTQSENLRMMPNCLNEQHCTCGARSHKKVLVSKLKIYGAGLNFQNCKNQSFPSPDFSFEALFQGIRRSWRFGQKDEVNIYITTTDTMTNVIQSIKQKEKQFEIMQAEMSKAVNKNLIEEKTINLKRKFKEYKTKNFMYQLGDSVQLIRNLESESVGFSIWSPPFPTLYVYSNEIEDMGNSKDFNEFFTGFNFLLPDLNRVMMSGRNVAVHCMDVPIQKGKEGYIGLRDFSGMIVDSFLKAGFIYHSRVTLWKNPVTEMQRTKALGLLHKQIKKDAAMCRVGIPDYLLIFRKEGENEVPIIHQDKDPLASNYLPVDLWQKYASPVWMDIDFGDTLNGRNAKEEDDERHIAPLALPIINRALHLWSNEGDTVLTTYGGIGSEGSEAIKLKRKAILFELKESYFNEGVQNCLNAEKLQSQKTLFDEIDYKTT